MPTDSIAGSASVEQGQPAWEIARLFSSQVNLSESEYLGLKTGADLVLKVASEDDPDPDLITKRKEYAQAKIQEYWIVDENDILVFSFKKIFSY